MSKIEWTDETWNPVSGCTRVSAGCDKCYAVSQTQWLAGIGQAKYKGLVNPGKNHFNGVVKMHVDELKRPFTWGPPRLVFVNSMSDLFHSGVSDAFLQRVFDVMRRADRHTFQVLTKRPDRAAAFVPKSGWPENVWLGTSVEDAYVLNRVDFLRLSGAHVKFLSCEPLIGPLHHALDLEGIDWVIAGGESDPHGKARRMRAHWARGLRDLCTTEGVPFFFKQWGSIDEHGAYVGKDSAGRALDGRTHDEYPKGWERRLELQQRLWEKAKQHRVNERRRERARDRSRRIVEVLANAFPVVK